VPCWSSSHSRTSSSRGVCAPSSLFGSHAQLFTTDVSPLSAPYRASAPDVDSDSDSEDQAARISWHERRPGALTITPELLAAFRNSLDAHNVRLRFFSGGWTPLRTQLEQSPPYDIVLASETIYRTDALGAFLRVLRAVMQEALQRTLCLVAAKVLYFGVGGGVQEFVRAVEDEGGTVQTVWEHREGVGRRIMRVEW
jgi:protein-histidine N-methyltransferase